jgi:hypothetical protein
LILWFAALGLIAVNRQNIIDWWRLRDYQAPVAIAQLASQDTMTGFGRKVFYVNQPVVSTKASSSLDCPNDGGEQTIVLGCYHSGQEGIFLLSVTDMRLMGVEQVTAAHEMLHAAYERLDGKERARIDGLLQDYYRHDLHDQRILQTIEAYKKSEPHDVVNEMHSIFGTEIANLPAPLEQYYQRYFTNRKQVAAFASQYQSEFTSRRMRVAQADTQLEQLKAQIDAAEADLNSKQKSIASQQATLLGQRNSGNIAAYNAGVPAYNQLVDDYNNEIGRVQSLINQYNQLVASRNAVALEEDQLIKELSPDNLKPINH